ncbi:MAG: type I-E CRISPR-associated protein Cas5/CasD [Hyphomicrobiaceae bacterium]
MARHLVLRLDAPLMAFGGETIDNYGVIRRFPAKSMIVGLVANALGIERYEGERLQCLQDRLAMASRIECPGELLKDYQTVRLLADDQGWTTRGHPEGRNRTSPSFVLDQDHLRRTGKAVKSQTHRRFRDNWADAVTSVVFRLEPSDEPPTLDRIAGALQEPERPLFLGRKPCLPSVRLYMGEIDGTDTYDALAKAPPPPGYAWRGELMQWPDGEGPDHGPQQGRLVELCDERNWISGVHGGVRLVRVLDRSRGEKMP